MPCQANHLADRILQSASCIAWCGAGNAASKTAAVMKSSLLSKADYVCLRNSAVLKADAVRPENAVRSSKLDWTWLYICQGPGWQGITRSTTLPAHWGTPDKRPGLLA